jgi:hypothetical protein
VSRFDNSSASAQRARDLANARATGTKPPARNGSPVPSPAQKPVSIPKVQNVTINPDPTGRK